jgi:hypothetical protein
MTYMNGKIAWALLIILSILLPVACHKDDSKWKASLKKCLKEEKRDIRTCKYLASMEENER